MLMTNSDLLPRNALIEHVIECHVFLLIFEVSNRFFKAQKIREIQKGYLTSDLGLLALRGNLAPAVAFYLISAFWAFGPI